jgi:asparagine synthase (glutamine-hydrolysing)
LYGFASFVGLRSVVIRLEKNHLIKYLRTLSPRSISINHWKKLIDSLSITKEVKKFVNKSDFPRIVDFLLYLPDGMLFKVDRASMAVGLEARVPFLDNRIIDMGMSKEMLDEAKPLKWRLKEVLRDLVPYYDFERPKTGFSLPLAQWMRDDWSDVILDLISSDDVNLLGLNRFRLKWEYRKLMRGNDYYAYRLWIDCNLILWFQSKKKL